LESRISFTTSLSHLSPGFKDNFSRTEVSAKSGERLHTFPPDVKPLGTFQMYRKAKKIILHFYLAFLLSDLSGGSIKKYSYIANKNGTSAF